MRFSIEKKDIVSNIQHLYNIVPGKNAMAILTNYLIEADEVNNTVKFSATDLELTVVVDFGANVIESGRVTVSAKSFTEILNSLPDALVNIYKDENMLRIVCLKSSFSLLTTDDSQFPLVPEKKLENAVEIDALLLSKMISTTDFAVSMEQNRPIFTGLYWMISPENQIMAATDGKKIAECKVNLPTSLAEKSEHVLSLKSLSFLQKIISTDHPKISVLLENNKVMFAYDNYLIFTHTIEGKYPDYTKVFPLENNNKLAIDKNILKNAVKRVSLMATDDSFRIKLDITQKSMIVSSLNREVGDAQEEITELEYAGEPIGIAFNFRFLNSILSALESERVIMAIGDPKGPVLFFNSVVNENYLSRFLLMPLRLSN